MSPTMYAVSFILYLSVAGCTNMPQSTPPKPPGRLHQEVIALVDGQAITHKTIEQALYELAGDEVLREYVLDRALERQCIGLGIEVSPAQIKSERDLLAKTIADDTQSNTRVLDTLRQRRGLGPDRYDRLLVRNAKLRALTTASSEPTQDAIDRATLQAFGVQSRVRLCVSDDAQVLSQLAQRVNAAPPETRSVVFADGCFAFSTHPSADRGGLIPSLSPADQGYPQSLRAALSRTPIGGCSPVISTEAGYAIVLVEAREPPREPTGAQRTQLLDQLRLDTQRRAMQRLAQQLLDEHEVIVLDQSLNWAWSNRP